MYLRRNKVKHIIFMLVSLVVLSYSALAEEYTVSKITDGDTIHVIASDATEIVVRFDYIDTMESYKNNRAKAIAKACKVRINELITSGLEAKEYLITTLPLGSKVNIEFHGLDSLNKRSMGEIFLNGKSINEDMVRSGHAIPFFKYIKDPEIKKRYMLAYATSDAIEDPILNNECIKKQLK